MPIFFDRIWFGHEVLLRRMVNSWCCNRFRVYYYRWGYRFVIKGSTINNEQPRMSRTFLLNVFYLYADFSELWWPGGKVYIPFRPLGGPYPEYESAPAVG